MSSFDEGVCLMLDEEDEDILEYGTVNVGQRKVDRQSHGGIVSCRCFQQILSCIPCAAIDESTHFTDLGCSVGSAVLCMALNRPAMKVYGVDNDKERVDYLNERVGRYNDDKMKNVKVICADLTDKVVDWGWLGQKGIIYVNNINFESVVNLSVERIVMENAKEGTYIVALSPLFVGRASEWADHIKFVCGRGRGRCHKLDVAAGYVSWAGGDVTLKVYVYEIKSALPRVE